jgi:hypothetical protein
MTDVMDRYSGVPPLQLGQGDIISMERGSASRSWKLHDGQTTDEAKLASLHNVRGTVVHFSRITTSDLLPLHVNDRSDNKLI